jgi:hypothetical protein
VAELLQKFDRSEKSGVSLTYGIYRFLPANSRIEMTTERGGTKKGICVQALIMQQTVMGVLIVNIDFQKKIF